MPKTKKIIGWILFVFVFSIYAFSASRTITFWDSPEFIASNFTLQASHPPGAPFYTIIAKVILSIIPSANIAFVCNLISGFFGALTILVVYLITCYIVENIQSKKTSNVDGYVSICCGLVSAFSLAFSHSFWIAATETEVYTLSFLLLVLLFYLMLKWVNTKDYKKAMQLLFLVALVFGISTGVHPILLTAIIPFSLLYTSKKFGLSLKNTVISLFVGCVLFFCVYSFVFQGVIKTAAHLDIWLVNTYSFSVNTASIVIVFFISIFFACLLFLTHKKQMIAIHHVTLMFLFFLLGVSSYVMPMLRVNANTFVSNNLHTNNRLLQYVQGEQFGLSKIPLVKGQVFNAPLDKDKGFLNGNPIQTYDSNTKKYSTVDDGTNLHVNYPKEFTTFFPRMFKKSDAHLYKSWTTIKGTPISYPVKGKIQKIAKPTFGENLSFFFNYQVYWLNLRYLFWNFIGRQNDNHGLGYIKDGNWKSGINAFDKSRIGDASMIPTHYKNDMSNDSFYFLPFILGILGLISLRKHKKYFYTTLVLFLTFGIGITIYVNPLPSSILIRERDYIFIGSFVVFSIWIGLSIHFLFQALAFIKSEKIRLISIVLLVSIIAPIQLLAKGWDDHNRSKDKFAYDFGKAYLDACPKQAILITNGDNMIFPLWYLQEVEGYRKDVRVINFAHLNLDTYVSRLKRKIHDAEPIKISLKKDSYVNGAEKLFPLQEETKEAAVLPVLFEFLSTEHTKVNWNGRMRHYIPSTTFSLPIDTLKYQNINPKDYNADFTNEIRWNYAKDFYGLNELVVYNIVMNNIYDRPICFANNGKPEHYAGLQAYTIQHGLVDQLLPITRKNKNLNPKIVNTKTTYDHLMNTVSFDGLNDANTFVDYEHKTYVQNILRRNYYFLAQALFEEGKSTEAIQVLDKVTNLFPNETIAYKQFAFALGKLYFKLGQVEKGNEVTQTAMQNIWDELIWMTSFDPPNTIINVRHANKLRDMYAQMITQLQPHNSKIASEKAKALLTFDTELKNWQKRNWPY